MADNPRWSRRPAGSTWGDFGADDERGRLNLLTPEKVLQGIAEVKVGKAFCLSLPFLQCSVLHCRRQGHCDLRRTRCRRD